MWLFGILVSIESVKTYPFEVRVEINKRKHIGIVLKGLIGMSNHRFQIHIMCK